MKKNIPATNQTDSLPDVTLTQFRGVLYMHFGTDWIQGAMRLGKPNEIVLDYVQFMMIWMLFNRHPTHIVQLGLGSAALTKFCYHHFPDTKVTAVELNPKVIESCRNTFYLPENDSRLTVIQADAKDYIASKRKKPDIDILQVDLYDENAVAPVFDSPEFYRSCAEALTEKGLLTLNVFGEGSEVERSVRYVERSFAGVVSVEEGLEGNRVVLGFKESEEVYFEELEARARAIEETSGLNATLWVKGLKAWSGKGGGR